MRTLVIALVLALPAQAGAIYNFTSFNGPGNNVGGTTVNGLNNNGDVVGFSSDNAATPTLFTNFIRDPNGNFTTLGIGGDPLAMANGINDSLTVAGGQSNGTAFVDAGGTVLPLAFVNGNTTTQTAFGISGNGLIVGQYFDSVLGVTPGYLLQNGTYTTLNPVVNAFVTNAQGVNNNGLAAGFYSTDGAHQHGFLYNSVTQAFTLEPDPNISNLVLTQFLSINDQGQVAGYYQLPDGSQHGFLFDTNTRTYTLLDEPNAALTGVSVTQITGLNDSGEIAGFYVDVNTGLQRGFVATAATATPEPGTLGLLPVSLVVMLAFQKAHARHPRQAFRKIGNGEFLRDGVVAARAIEQQQQAQADLVQLHRGVTGA